jgi:hypothetical protein
LADDLLCTQEQFVVRYLLHHACILLNSSYHVNKITHISIVRLRKTSRGKACEFRGVREIRDSSLFSMKNRELSLIFPAATRAEARTQHPGFFYEAVKNRVWK